jgi:hypothetical protein
VDFFFKGVSLILIGPLAEAIQGPMKQISNPTSTEREIVRSDCDFKTFEEVYTTFDGTPLV